MGLVINNLPKFSAVVFSSDKTKNADVGLVTASIFNAVWRKKNKQNC